MLNYLIKAGMLFSQIASLGILTEHLKIEDLAIYFTIISTGAILLIFVDFGFIRYSFILVSKSVNASIIINQAFKLIMIGLLIAGPVFIFWSHLKGYSLSWIFCTIISSILSKLNNLNRYFFIDNNNILGAMIIEGLQPIFYLIFLFFTILFSHYNYKGGINLLSLNQVFLCYLLSFILAFALSILMTKTKKVWSRGLYNFKKQNTNSTMQNIRISFPVGVEAMLSTIWFNLLVVISNSFHYTQATAIIGIFQRLLSFANAFVSVSVVVNLKKYYKEKIGTRFFLLLSGIAIVIFLLFWIALYCFSIISTQYFINLNLQALELLYQLSVFPMSIAFCISLLYLFSNLSFAALGADKRYLRIFSVLGGLSALILTEYLIVYVGGIETEDYAKFSIVAMGISLATASLILSYGMFVEKKQK